MARSKTPERQDPHGRRPCDQLDELEASIEQLRVAYEKYFLGIERRPPSELHDRVRRMLREIEKTRPSRSALRFRLQGLRARLVTYEQYWTRILRKIEEGTYERHVRKAKQRMAEADRPGPKRPATTDDGVDPAQARRLYRELVAAKKASGESTKGLSYGAFVDTLRRTVPKLRARHGGDVDLVVVQKGGKVKLVARPR
ncbi:MAG: hypothetical protein D6705_18590 [Deltaproteobacteria bacterium]|nr:MAG: hypothetical protein D6705_18590 [Deltaproteobacteria bacterium]